MLGFVGTRERRIVCLAALTLSTCMNSATGCNKHPYSTLQGKNVHKTIKQIDMLNKYINKTQLDTCLYLYIHHVCMYVCVYI